MDFRIMQFVQFHPEVQHVLIAHSKKTEGDEMAETEANSMLENVKRQCLDDDFGISFGINALHLRCIATDQRHMRSRNYNIHSKIV